MLYELEFTKLSRPFRLLKMGVDALRGPFDKILKFLQPVTNVLKNIFEEKWSRECEMYDPYIDDIDDYNFKTGV